MLALGLAPFGCRKPASPASPKHSSDAARNAGTAHSAGNSAATPAGTYVPAPGEDPFSLKSHPDATVLQPLDPSTLSESERKFGRAPHRDPSVEYQPDIILMEQGDKAIRSFGSDDLTWTFDANAPHVNEFAMDKIVFATGRAVGRILMLQPQGDTVKVILGPIQLTDVIKNANVAMDAPIDLDTMIPVVSPDFPQEAETPGPAQAALHDKFRDWNKTVVLSRIAKSGKWIPASMTSLKVGRSRETYRRVGRHWVLAPTAPPVLLMPERSTGRPSPAGWYAGPSASVRPAVYVPSRTDSPVGQALLRNASWAGYPPSLGAQGTPLPGVPGVRIPGAMKVPPLDVPAIPSVPDLNIEGGETRTIGSRAAVGIQYTYEKQGVRVVATGMLEFEGAHIRFFLKIADGKAPTSCGMDLMGAVGVRLHLNSNTNGEFKVNISKKIWLPVQFFIPISGAIPFNLSFDQALIVNSGFSAKNSIMNADGNYIFTGGLTAGLVNGQWMAKPLLTVKSTTDLGNTVEGISVGINSLVLGAETRVMVGLGIGPFNTGLYATLSYVGTMLRQSDLGFPCRQGTIEANLHSGLGYSIPKWVTDVVNGFLSLFTKKRMERVGTMLKGPDVGLFHGLSSYPGGCAGAGGQ